jgi:hypothetical protein
MTLVSVGFPYDYRRAVNAAVLSPRINGDPGRSDFAEANVFADSFMGSLELVEDRI